MKEEKLFELIHKKATNALTKAESQQLNDALKNADNQHLAKEVESAWDKSLDYQKDFQVDVEAGLSKFKTRIQNDGTPTKVVPMQGRRSWLSIAAAAAILVVGSLFLWNTFNSGSGYQKVATTDSTEQLDLSDGSKIWINSNSQFQYPSQFENNQRLVELEGEAFFDIAKNPDKPFVIEAGDLRIKVLGTSFNVRNYAADNFAQVTVRSGRVEVTNINGGFKEILEANDQLTFDKKRLKIREKSTDKNLNALAWWSGKIAFDNEKMSKVKEAIENAYDVELEFSNPEILDCRYTISNDVKAEGLSVLLEVMESALDLKVKKVNKNKYQVVGGNCPENK